MARQPRDQQRREAATLPAARGEGGKRRCEQAWEPRRRRLPGAGTTEETRCCRQSRLKQRAPGSKRLVYPQPTLCLPLAISSRQPVSKGAWKTQCVEAAENQNKQANDLHGFPEEITSIFVSFIHHKIFTLIEIKDSQGKKKPH